jgi:hypothetical protein
MNHNLSDNPSGQATRMAVSFLAIFVSLTGTAFAQTRGLNAVPAGAVSTARRALPKGVKVLAQLPLEGQPVTRMYTQSESGRTYLYIEHGRQPLTAVDVTRKRNPKVVNHEPAKVDAGRYRPAEGGPVEVSAPKVIAEFDNVGGRGMLSTLQSGDRADAPLLQAFGRDSSNLADLDRKLIFFASPTRLLVVEDDRWTGVDYSVN